MKHSINFGTRKELWSRVSKTKYDVIVIGGGITGAGCALDAAARGLRTLLVERVDLAAGTSRWSSKLVHGGLRYLAKADFPVAWESAVERHALMSRIAPHLTRPIPTLIPLDDTTKPIMGILTEAGVRVADIMRFAARTNHRLLPSPARVSALAALTAVPALRENSLRGGIIYWDGQLEDDARLVIAIARTAASLGADILTHCAASNLTEKQLTLTDEFSGESKIANGIVINATGVWAGDHESRITVTPSRGSHIVVPAELLGYPRAVFSAPVAEHFGRFVFAIPHHDGYVHIGLTDELALDADGIQPEVPKADEEFLLKNINRVLDKPLTSADIVGRYAGLRPLISEGKKNTADVSRKHLLISEAGRPITITGGKLTTYRQMAEEAVDAAAKKLEIVKPSPTRNLALIGAASRKELKQLAAPETFIRRYGTEAKTVMALEKEFPEFAKPVAKGCLTRGGEFLFAILHEGALTVSDIVERRTRVSFVESQIAEAQELAQKALDTLLPELKA